MAGPKGLITRSLVPAPLQSLTTHSRCLQALITVVLGELEHVLGEHSAVAVLLETAQAAGQGTWRPGAEGVPLSAAETRAFSGGRSRRYADGIAGLAAMPGCWPSNAARPGRRRRARKTSATAPATSTGKLRDRAWYHRRSRQLPAWYGPRSPRR